MSEVLSLWKRQPRAQTPDLSADRFAHIMEMSEIEVFKKQTCQQSLLSFREMSQHVFLLLLLKCMRGECLGLCDCSEEHQFTPGCSVCACVHRPGGAGHEWKLVPPKDSAGAPLVWDICDQLQRVHTYLFTCTGTTVQQPSTIKTMEEKANQISLLFDK